MATNLYPPLIASEMPSFIRARVSSNDTVNGKCKIYFSLSSYNNLEDIRYLQLTATYLKTNKNALDTTAYANEIKMFSKSEFVGPNSNDEYYVILDQADVQGGFLLNTYYKIQLRFVSMEAPATNNLTAGWLYDNINNFSEWSTVCLIKGIDQPTFTSTIPNKVTSKLIKISATMRFGSTEKEYLSKYQVNLYDDLNFPIEFTDWIYSSLENLNQITHQFKTELADNKKYTIGIKYVTNGGYESEWKKDFSTSLSAIIYLNNILFTAKGNKESGSIDLQVFFPAFLKAKGDLVIKRASAESNFKLWEDMHILGMQTIAGYTQYTWKDVTIESGMFYKYALAIVKNDVLLEMKIINTPVMLELEDMYLVDNYHQLNIRYNSTVQNLNYVINDTITATLGSQYPYVSRNGNNKYRQFNISGLISSQSDEYNLFTRKEKIYGEALELYNDYNKKNNINEYNDFIYERKFREAVLDFLYNGNVKLYKSNTEGNMLVRITNISLTPNQSLGRRLWTFNATLTEIDDFTVDNCSKYHVQNIEWDDDNPFVDIKTALYVYKYEVATSTALIDTIDYIEDKTMVLRTYVNGYKSEDPLINDSIEDERTWTSIGGGA